MTIDDRKHTLIYVPSTGDDSQALIRLKEFISLSLQFRFVSKWNGSCRYFAPASTQNVLSVPTEISKESQTHSMYYVNFNQSTTGVGMIGPITSSHFDEAKYVIGGKELGTILSKLKNLWMPRQSLNLEGSSYSRAGLYLKLGQLTTGSTSKGIVVYLIKSADDAVEDLFLQLIGYLNHSFESRIIEPAGMKPETTVDITEAKLIIRMIKSESLL